MTVRPMTKAEQDCVGPTPLNLHPDGEPWDKCCSNPSDNTVACQCFCKKPPNAPSRLDFYLSWPFNMVHRLVEENGRFFCIHRSTDDGYHRECAGWAKIKGKLHEKSK